MLFHKDIWMPENLKNEAKFLILNMKQVRLSKHITEWLNGATNESLDRFEKHEYTKADLGKALNIIKATLPVPFEIEADRNGISKFVCRVTINEATDMSVVIGFTNKQFTIRTAWLNSRFDLHTTLNESKYAKQR